MFPMNLFDSVMTDYTRRVRRINCLGWMQEHLSRTRRGRFARRDRTRDANTI